MSVQTITTTGQLQALCERLSQHSFVTVDTEFLREKTYYPKLCLIQVASDDESAIIDPLVEDIDLSPFWGLMDNVAVTKVFHAARQDLEIFYQMMERLPQNLFDTQIAAMVCGFGEQVGYETLVQKITKQPLDKSSRFTDWSKRPLTDKQIHYAIGDVTHLRDIYKHLYGMLADKNRLHWLDEEFQILTNAETYVMKPENAWKRLKTRGGKPKFLVVLKAIAGWREELAQRKDIPRGRIVRDDTLLNMAAATPKTVQDLENIRSFPKGLAHSHQGQEILKAIEDALHTDKSTWPVVDKPKTPPPWVAPMADMLRVLLKYYATKENVAGRIIANNTDIDSIAQLDTEHLQQAGVPAMQGWRYEIFGQYAEKLKRGEIAITADKDGLKVIDIDK